MITINREAVKAAIHPALHDLGVRIVALETGECHCNLIAEVILDAIEASPDATSAPATADLEAAQDAHEGELGDMRASLSAAEADRDDWKTRCEQAWGQLDQAHADLAAMTARAESAEARYDEVRAERNSAMSVMEMAEGALDKMQADIQTTQQNLTEVNRRVVDLVAERDRLGQIARFVDVTTLDSPNQQLLCNHCGHITETAHPPVDGYDEMAPETAPASTRTGPQAAVVGVDGSDGPGGSEGDSGGAR